MKKGDIVICIDNGGLNLSLGKNIKLKRLIYQRNFII